MSVTDKKSLDKKSLSTRGRRSKTLYQAGEAPEQQPPPSIGKVGYRKLSKNYRKIKPAIVSSEQMTQTSVDVPLSEHSYGLGLPEAHRNMAQKAEERKLQERLRKDQERDRVRKQRIEKAKNKESGFSSNKKKVYIEKKKVKKDITFKNFPITDKLRDQVIGLQDIRKRTFESRTESFLRKKE